MFHGKSIIETLNLQGNLARISVFPCVKSQVLVKSLCFNASIDMLFSLRCLAPQVSSTFRLREIQWNPNLSWQNQATVARRWPSISSKEFSKNAFSQMSSVPWPSWPHTMVFFCEFIGGKHEQSEVLPTIIFWKDWLSWENLSSGNHGFSPQHIEMSCKSNVHLCAIQWRWSFWDFYASVGSWLLPFNSHENWWFDHQLLGAFYCVWDQQPDLGIFPWAAQPR